MDTGPTIPNTSFNDNENPKEKESKMLVLSRKKNEGITIDHPSGAIHIVVVEVRGDKVRIGIEAERDVMIHRDEIRKRIEAGEPLRRIENDLDHRENLKRTTSTIPMASLSPEHRQKSSPLVEAIGEKLP